MSIIPCPNCASLNRLPSSPQNGLEAKCGKCKTPLGKPGPVHSVDTAGLRKIVLNSPLPVVVDFWAPWCGPCLAFAPTFEQCAKEHKETALFLKLDTEAHPDAGALFNIRGIPTLMVFENEKEKARQSGAMPLPMLKQWLGSHFKL